MGKTKESTIDFYVVCERVLPYVTNMKIDNGKTHIITNYGSTDNTGHSVNSDHFPLTMEVKLEVPPSKVPKIEILNFKDTNGLIEFKENTSNTEEFTKIVGNVCTLSEDADKWIKAVKAHYNISFKKIRIRTRNIKPSNADRLISERNKLVQQGKVNDSRVLDVKIAKIISEEGRQKAAMFKKYMDNDTSSCLSEM